MPSPQEPRLSRRALIGASPLLLFPNVLLAESAAPASQEPNPRKLFESFPEDASDIPGAGRIDKRKGGHNGLLIRINQRRMHYGLAKGSLKDIQEEQERVERVQSDIGSILWQLVGQEEKGRVYFPHSQSPRTKGDRILYWQSCMEHVLKGAIMYQDHLEFIGEEDVEVHRKAKAKLRAYREENNEATVTAPHLLAKRARFKLQQAKSIRFEDNALGFNRYPVMVAVYQMGETIFGKERRDDQELEHIYQWKHGFSVIAIEPESMLKREDMSPIM